MSGTKKMVKGKDITTYNREYAFSNKVINKATYEDLMKRRDRYSKSLLLVEEEMKKRDNLEELKRKEEEEKKRQEEELEKTKNEVKDALKQNKKIVVLQKKREKILEKANKMYNDLRHILTEMS